MTGPCNLGSASTGPISVSQFLDHFRRAWTESSISGVGRCLPRRLGLAVSGGADSMSLAYLCKQLERSGYVEDLSVTAFVVDHKAREESSQEARTVAQWLDELNTDIRTKILELDWSTNTDANASGKGKPTAFETFARRLRFQALGTACRENQIETLMMGHHQDDNVETTLWRLCTRARGAGLAGIPQVARIPECHGIYGVSESGSLLTLSELKKNTPGSGTGIRINKRGEIDLEQNQRHPNSQITISTGGIALCRPLLSFPKSQFLATCHQHDVPFVTDPTNFDPKLTPRNAIRSLLASNQLPRALQSTSILSLIKKSQDLLKESRELSNGLLRGCKLLDFRLTTGVAVIQFPSRTMEEALPARKTKNPLQRRHQVQTMTLRRITELISPFPENHFSLRSFENFTDRVFPTTTNALSAVSSEESSLSPSSSKIKAPKQQTFTLGGVMLQPLQWKSSSTATTATEHHNNNNDNGNDSVWLLSRQPFMRGRLPILHLGTPFPSPSTTNSPTNPQNEHKHNLLSLSLSYTPWTLWDNRYWFRIAISPDPRRKYDSTSEAKSLPVIIRPLQQSDIRRIRDLLSSSTDEIGRVVKVRDHPIWMHLTETLSREAPGQSRFTLPVLAVKCPEFAEERVLALPTMNLRLPVSVSLLGNEPWEIHWEWMYKMIDDQTVKSMS